MLKTNTVGRKLYFSVLAVFLVFAVSFIVFQQTREKQYKISTLTLKLANYNELLVEDLALSSSNGILLSDTVNLVDSVRVAEAKLEDFVQEHESKDLRVTLIKPDGKVIYDNMGNILKTYFYINDEEALAVRSMSSSQIQLVIEESIERHDALGD